MGQTKDKARAPLSLFFAPFAPFALSVLLLPACQQESHITRYKPFFANIADAQFGDQKPINADAGYVDPTQAPDNKIVITNPDGSKRLIARSVQHMMQHLERCLDENDDAILLTQVLSQKTAQHYREMGKDPIELIQSLKDNRKDLAKTFSRMPLGEHSPTVILEQPGDKTWIIKVTGAAAKDLKFTRLWARMEDRNWRFLWLD
jgi:hypothetical protein